MPTSLLAAEPGHHGQTLIPLSSGETGGGLTVVPPPPVRSEFPEAEATEKVWGKLPMSGGEVWAELPMSGESVWGELPIVKPGWWSRRLISPPTRSWPAG